MPRRPLLLLVACLSAVLGAAARQRRGRRRPAPRPSRSRAAQSVAVRVLPQLAATGATPEPAVGRADHDHRRVLPGRAGRAPHLEVLDGRKWVAIAIADQDAAGRVLFTAPYAWRGVPATYRVAARARPTCPAGRSRRRCGPTPGGRRSCPTSSPGPRSRRPGTTACRATRCRAGAARRRTRGRRRSAAACCRSASSTTPTATTRARSPTTWASSRRPSTGSTATSGRRAGSSTSTASPRRASGSRRRVVSTARSGCRPRSWTPATRSTSIEWFGAGSSGLSSGVWSYSGGTQTKVAEARIGDGAAYGSDWAGSYHVFSVEWTPTEYVFRIDGTRDAAHVGRRLADRGVPDPQPAGLELRVAARHVAGRSSRRR